MPQQRSSILRTKLFIVRPRGELVEREALKRRLDMIPRQKLTLVSAPAGFGKTTAVSAWLERHDYPVAWISLDASDSDITHFLSYLVAALQTIEPTIGQSVARGLDAAPVPAAESLLASLVNDLAALDRDIVLVLDDYNTIEGDAVHHALLFLLEHAPPTLHIVVTTRVDPPIPLARFRVRGDMAEIRAADLRFSESEAAALFNDLMQLGLPQHHLEALLRKTEGWIAGLHMAGLSLRGREDVDDFITAFTGADRYVLDYLLEETLALLPKDLQRTVLELSVLNRFNDELCEAVTGCADGAETLHELDRRNLFLISLDNRREWYRYHQLFAELLRHRLQQSEGDRIPELHRRASLWHSAQGNMREAIDHARQSGDLVLLADIIDRHWRSLLRSNDSRRIWNLVSTLPDDLVIARPGVAIHKGWLLVLYNRFDEALELFRSIEATAVNAMEDEKNREIVGITYLLRATMKRDSDSPEETIRLAGRALELLPDHPVTSPEYLWNASHGMVLTVLAAAYGLTGDHLRAEALYREALQHSRRSSIPSSIMSGLVNLGRHQIQMGKLADAAESERELAQLGETTDFPLPLAQFTTYHLRARILCERNNLQGAEEAVRAGLRDYAPRRTNVIVQMYRILFCVHDTQGKREEALRTIEEIERLTILPHESYLLRIAPMLRAQLALGAGDMETAERWYEETGEERSDGPQPTLYTRKLEEILRARILMASGRIEEAERMLSALQQELESMGVLILRLEALLLRSLALRRLKRDDEAFSMLEQALVLGAADGYIRMYAYEGEEPGEMILQLRKDRSRGLASLAADYVQQIVVACMKETPVDAINAVEPRRTEGGDHQLTTREMEILHLISLGFSNQKIADRLYVSINTIKTHTSNLFDKLGARNRVDALVRAREAKIL